MSKSSRLLPWTALAALFVGALVAVFRRVGWSPLLWLDTLNYERGVRLCLEQGQCSLDGGMVSFGHLLQGASWHQLRAFMQWLGAGVFEAHVIMSLFDALAVVLVAVAGSRLVNRWAGLVSAILMLLLIDSMQHSANLLWNNRPLPFLGALFLMLGVLVAESGRLIHAVLAAMVAAIMTNHHLVGGMALLSLLWISVLVPGRRLVLVTATAIAYGGMLVLPSPGSWLHNLEALLMGGWLPAADQASYLQALVFPSVVIAGLVASAGLLLTYRRLERPAGRRLLSVLAVVVPSLAAFMAAFLLLEITRTDRYLLHVAPAVAVGISVPACIAARALWHRVAEHGLGERARRISWMAGKAAPYLAALVLCIIPAPEVPHHGHPLLTFREVQEVGALLRKSRAWDRSKVFRSLKSPKDANIVDGLLTCFPYDGAPRTMKPGDESTNAIVLKTRAGHLPDPLPSDWHVVSMEEDYAVVVVFMPSWLDWERFEVCTSKDLSQEAIDCRKVGLSPRKLELVPLSSIDGMPDVADLDSKMVLRIPVRLPQGQAVHEILMQRMKGLCAGRVVAAPGAASWVSPDGRRAGLKAENGTSQEGEIVLQWELGGPGCQPHSYQSFPPFFVEADPASMRLLEKIIAQYRR